MKMKMVRAQTFDSICFTSELKENKTKSRANLNQCIRQKIGLSDTQSLAAIMLAIISICGREKKGKIAKYIFSLSFCEGGDPLSELKAIDRRGKPDPWRFDCSILLTVAKSVRQCDVSPVAILLVEVQNRLFP